MPASLTTRICWKSVNCELWSGLWVAYPVCMFSAILMCIQVHGLQLFAYVMVSKSFSIRFSMIDLKGLNSAQWVGSMLRAGSHLEFPSRVTRSPQTSLIAQNCPWIRLSDMKGWGDFLLHCSPGRRQMEFTFNFISTNGVAFFSFLFDIS